MQGGYSKYLYIRYEFKEQIDHNDQIVQSDQMSHICQIDQMGYWLQDLNQTQFVQTQPSKPIFAKFAVFAVFVFKFR